MEYSYKSCEFGYQLQSSCDQKYGSTSQETNKSSRAKRFTIIRFRVLPLLWVVSVTSWLNQIHTVPELFHEKLFWLNPVEHYLHHRWTILNPEDYNLLLPWCRFHSYTHQWLIDYVSFLSREWQYTWYNKIQGFKLVIVLFYLLQEINGVFSWFWGNWVSSWWGDLFKCVLEGDKFHPVPSDCEYYCYLQQDGGLMGNQSWCTWWSPWLLRLTCVSLPATTKWHVIYHF